MKKRNEKKLGRPPLGAEKKRFRIAASFTLEERNSIFEVAEWCSLAPSEVLRCAALLVKIKPPTPKVNLEALRVINEINKNFSLLLKRLEEDRTVDANVADTYFRILAGLKSVIMESK